MESVEKLSHTAGYGIFRSPPGLPGYPLPFSPQKTRKWGGGGLMGRERGLFGRFVRWFFALFLLLFRFFFCL